MLEILLGISLVLYLYGIMETAAQSYYRRDPKKWVSMYVGTYTLLLIGYFIFNRVRRN